MSQKEHQFELLDASQVSSPISWYRFFPGKHRPSSRPRDTHNALKVIAFIIRNSMFNNVHWRFHVPLHAPVFGRMNLAQVLQFMELVWISYMLRDFQWKTGDWGLLGEWSNCSGSNFKMATQKFKPELLFEFVRWCKDKGWIRGHLIFEELAPNLLPLLRVPQGVSWKMDGSLTSELMGWHWGHLLGISDMSKMVKGFPKMRSFLPVFLRFSRVKTAVIESSLWSQGAKSQATSSVAQRSSIPPANIHPPIKTATDWIEFWTSPPKKKNFTTGPQIQNAFGFPITSSRKEVPKLP